MKKLHIIYSALLLAFITSCKKDNIENVTSKTNLPDTSSLNMVDVSFAETLAPGSFRIIAGKTGISAAVDGNGQQARFLSPSGVFVNTDASLLVADFHGSIRKLVHDTVVTTVPFPADGGGNPFDGASDVAVSRDGTIAAVDKEELWLYNGPEAFYSENPSDNYGGIDKDPLGNGFWYIGISAMFQMSLHYQYSPLPLTVGNARNFKAISASNNGVKYFSTVNQMFKYTKSGVSARIFPDFTFTNITSITSSRDGFKVYVADNGDIRMISNNSLYPKDIKTILTGQHVVGIALSNSEKYIYFTTTTNTVNKLAL
jgi:hypothetical protein